VLYSFLVYDVTRLDVRDSIGLILHVLHDLITQSVPHRVLTHLEVPLKGNFKNIGYLYISLQFPTEINTSCSKTPTIFVPFNKNDFRIDYRLGLLKSSRFHWLCLSPTD